MKCLVTGASGFVGSAVVNALLDDGHQVRVLVRSSSPRENVASLPIEIYEGDLKDKASLSKALLGCESLFHVAADYRLWTPDPNELYENNVTGTRNLMEAALEQKLARIVYTSSVATLKPSDQGIAVSEDSIGTADSMVGHYKRSKFLAEAEVDRLVREAGLNAVIVNPSTPIGPRDVKPTPTGRIIFDAMRGRIPAYVDTGLNIVHVDDVAKGHLLAFEKGQIGRRYILGGDDMTLREILYAVARFAGRRPPVVRLPRRMLYPIAVIAQEWARLTNGPEPQTTIDGLRMAAKKMFFDSSRAKSELGYVARPGVNAIEEAVHWFQARA
ncbi:MAG: hopanoid-associated sugar epimerase [Pseudomonadota bacterium]